MQLIIKLTTSCNLKCSYCSEGDKKAETISKESLYKVIDDLPELLKELNDHSIEILWHGGEPMLVNIEFLDTVMCYAEKILSEFELRFCMQSNGTMLNPEWLSILKMHNVMVGISLDGYKEIHDKNRRTKSDMPTFDTIIKNIKLLRDYGIYGGSLMVLSDIDNIDVDKLFEFIQTYELPMKINPVIPCGRAENIIDIDNIYAKYNKIMELLYRKSMELDYPMDIEPLSDIIEAMIRGKSVKECSYNGACGKHFMCIFTNGSVGFCGRAESKLDELCFGNINENSLKNMYNSVAAERIRKRHEFLKLNDCKACNEWQFCMGGCSFEAVNGFGVLEHKYPGCQQRKELIKFIRTEGIELLKKKLVNDKRKLRDSIKLKRKLLGELKNERK